VAGIGFRLRKILSKGTYSSLITAYFYGAIIATGPWIISVASIGVLTFLCKEFLLQSEQVLFRTLIVYTYMGTLLFTGPFYMSTTRYLADRMFKHDFYCVLPTYRYVSIYALIFGGVGSGLFYILGGLELKIALSAMALFQAVTLTWTAMIFLSAARDYIAIAFNFLSGYLIGIVCGYLGAEYYGLAGMLWGFTAGMLFLAMMLSVRVSHEFPSFYPTENAVRNYWYTMPWLCICGLCYNAALWADKFILWLYTGKKSAPGPFFAPTDYDTCYFWAYLTIVPAMTIFLIRIETSFYGYYSEFFGAVTDGAPLKIIEQRRDDVAASLLLSITRLLKIQGGISALAIFLAPYMLQYAGMSPDLVTLLRIAFLGAFIQSLFLIEVIIVLYFDWKKLAGALSLLALVLNTVCTVIFYYFGYKYLGFGCLVAFLTSLVVGAWILERRLKELIFDTFSKQFY